MNLKLKIFLYIAVWIIAWLIFSFIINAGLITTSVYSENEKGTILTFLFGAVVFLAGAASLYREVFPNKEPS